MPTCPHCGAKISDGAIQHCPSCQHELGSNAGTEHDDSHPIAMIPNSTGDPPGPGLGFGLKALIYSVLALGALVIVSGWRGLVGLVGFVLPFMNDPSVSKRSGIGPVLLFVLGSSVWVGFGAQPIGSALGRRVRRRFGDAAVDRFLNRETTEASGWFVSSTGRSVIRLSATLGWGLLLGLAYGVVVPR